MTLSDYWRDFAQAHRRIAVSLVERTVRPHRAALRRVLANVLSGTGRWGPAVAGLATLGLLYWRAHDAFTAPQIRGEDGTIFFLQERLDGISSFLIPYAGYLHFIPRLVAWLASPFGAVAAPELYLAGSVVIAFWSAVTVATARVKYAWLLGAVLLAVPHTGEVFALVTEAQWIMAPALALALVTPNPASVAVRVNQGVFVAAASLSGPFCIFAIPLALWKMAQDRTRYARLLAAVVILAAAVQGTTVFATGEYEHLPRASGEAQSPIRLALLLADRWFGQLSHGAAQTQTGWQIAMLAVVGIGAISALLPRDRRTTFCLLYLFATLILAGTWGRFYRTSEWEWFANAQFSDRYFYVPRLFVIWSLILLIADVRPRSIVGIAAAGAIAANCPALWIKSAEPRLPWEEEARRIDRGEAVRIEINPKPWVVELPAHYKPDRDPVKHTTAHISTCQGSIDILRVYRTPSSLYARYARLFVWGVPPGGTSSEPAASDANGKVYVAAEGWLAATSAQNKVPDEVFLALTAPDGTRTLLKAPRISREDIRKAYKQPTMPNAGYRIFIDMTEAARGRYEVGLVGGYEGSLTLCSQLNGRIEID